MRDQRTAVGQAARDTAEAVAYALKAWVDRLTRNDVPPASVTVEPPRTVVFGFYTEFRKKRADELLPSGTKYGGQYVYVRNVVLSAEPEVGQVIGTAQSTPWTCGPAALRAVLAHHGDDVDEDTLAVLAGNVPVLGVRPSGLVKAATELGYRADVFQARGLSALAPFLARDLPVMVVVDSFTRPGKAGHWVVVTAVGPDRVVIMDPHVNGDWRRLTPAAFDARWWHREGGRVVRRLAVVVTPPALVAVGGDAPTHGRLARCKGSAWDKVGEAFGKVWRAFMKTAVNTVTGGSGSGVIDAWADKFHVGVKNMKTEERRHFFNHATNEELVIWSVGWARAGFDEFTKSSGDDSRNKKLARKFIAALGLTEAMLHGALEEVLRATLRTLLWYGAWAPMSLAPCAQEAAIQAHLILFYGPLAETWPLVRKKRKLPKGGSLDKIPAWVDAITADLDAYQAAHAESEREFA